MNISWDDAQLLLRIAETRSLSAAAKHLKLSQPTVTRRLAALEYQVGASLFRRSVTGVSLTNTAARLLPFAQKMAEWAGELNRAVDAHPGPPRGLVRVTSSPFVCFDFLAPFAGLLAQRHPEIRLEVLSSVNYLDLGRGEADLALRAKAPADGDLISLFSKQIENAVFVAKSLKNKLPVQPAINALPWIAWCPPFESLPPNPQLEALIPQFVPAFTSDHFLIHLAAAEAGAGAMVLGKVTHRLSRKSSLVPLEIDLGPHRFQEIHLVCAKSAYEIPRIRCVADLLVEELRHLGPSFTAKSLAGDRSLRSSPLRPAASAPLRDSTPSTAHRPQTETPLPTKR